MELNYKKIGSGPPLIILHGLMGMLDNWQTPAKYFAPHFEVYLVDQRNHGRSPQSEEFNYQVLADDLFEFGNYFVFAKYDGIVIVIYALVGGEYG